MEIQEAQESSSDHPEQLSVQTVELRMRPLYSCKKALQGHLVYD